MKTTIRKIGNSAGAILPAAILKKLQLSEGDAVSISEDGHRIVIEPTRKLPKYTLSELLAQCDEKALLPKDVMDWDAAKPVGNEVW